MNTTPTPTTPENQTDADRILGMLVRSALPELDGLLTRLWQVDALAGLAMRFETARTPAAMYDTAVELRRQVERLMSTVRALEALYERLEAQTEISTLLANGLPPVEIEAHGAGR